MRTDTPSRPVGAGRTPALTAAAVVTMAVYGILGVALFSKPPDHLPLTVMRALAVFPTLIAVNNALVLTSLLARWRAVREGRIERHRRFMMVSAALGSGSVSQIDPLPSSTRTARPNGATWVLMLT